MSGIAVQTTTTYEPSVRDKKFSLATGGTYERVMNARTTSVAAGITTGPTVAISRTTIVFMGLESVTVPAGSFTACRFRLEFDNSQGVAFEWYAKGSGVMVKSDSPASGSANVVLELEATSRLNGAAVQ